MKGGQLRSNFSQKNRFSVEAVRTLVIAKKSDQQKCLSYRLFSSRHYKCIQRRALEEKKLCCAFEAQGMPFLTALALGSHPARLRYYSCARIENNWCLKGYRHSININPLQTSPTPPLHRKNVRHACCTLDSLPSLHTAVPMEIRGEIFQILRGIPRITQWKSAALSAVIAIFCGKSTHFLRSIKAAFTWLQTEKACFRMRYIILVHNNIDMLNGVLTVYRYIMIQRNILLHMKRCT